MQLKKDILELSHKTNTNKEDNNYKPFTTLCSNILKFDAIFIFVLCFFPPLVGRYFPSHVFSHQLLKPGG